LAKTGKNRKKPETGLTVVLKMFVPAFINASLPISGRAGERWRSAQRARVSRSKTQKRVKFFHFARCAIVGRARGARCLGTVIAAPYTFAMQVREGLEGLRSIPPGSVLSVGNFDGMHRGHCRLLELANSLRGALSEKVAVVTFEPHPLTVLRPELAPPRLTAPAVKQKLLEEAGVDEYVVLPPSQEVLNLSAEAFFAILRDEVRPTHMVEGSSFNFGKGRGGNIDRLREWTRDSAIELHIVDAVTVPLLNLSVVPVSSSLIRWLLSHGRARDAAICLGRAYALRGEVVRGFGRGRDLGVPTANLKCDDQLIPADGVYAARCAIDRRPYATALSIGTLPTFDEHVRQVEAHLLDFDADLYGRVIEVEVVDWVREQWKFTSTEELMKQIGRDVEYVRKRAEIEASEPIAMG
jgi:riboflavin kinase / FMN adenylyltransferase